MCFASQPGIGRRIEINQTAFSKRFFLMKNQIHCRQAGLALNTGAASPFANILDWATVKVTKDERQKTEKDME